MSVTCDDCFFRRAQLCAIPGNTPCPTFRPADGGLVSPRHVATVVSQKARVRAAA